MPIPSSENLSVRSKVLALGLLVLCALSVTASAQEGASSASAARARYLAGADSIPKSKEIAVEEFINYHRHRIGLPKSGETVALDVRWGNGEASAAAGSEAVLQVGFSTAHVNDRQQLRPLNLSLVIDKSGSMADADKMSRVKTALLAMLPRLREEDTLSIVVFDCAAEVLMPARRLSDRASVERLIRGIEPGSCTNIHAGLMLGYREALKSYSRDATNRVVLLTDGIANEGVTDPKKIAAESLSYNDRGVDLSTIGVGFDLNTDLLRELAKSGRGLYHFVADAQDIEKVFIKELQSLISPVATSPVVEIDYGPGLELAQVYGYEPRRGERGLSIKLDNMNNGLTQVVMLRFRTARGRETGLRFPVTVRFTYYDLEKKRQVTLTQVESLTLKSGAAGDMLSDEEVGKNYTIALLAQSIRDMAAAWESQRFREAEDALTSAIAKTYRRYPTLEDADIERTLMVAQKYQEVVKKINQQRDTKSSDLR